MLASFRWSSERAFCLLLFVFCCLFFVFGCLFSDGTSIALPLPQSGILIEEPFVSLIVSGVKTWEIRSYPPPANRIGQRIAALSTGRHGPQKFRGEFVVSGWKWVSPWSLCSPEAIRHHRVERLDGAPSWMLIDRIQEIASKSKAPVEFAGYVCVWQISSAVAYPASGCVQDAINCFVSSEPRDWGGVQTWVWSEGRWNAEEPIEGLVTNMTFHQGLMQ